MKHRSFTLALSKRGLGSMKLLLRQTSTCANWALSPRKDDDHTESSTFSSEGHPGWFEEAFFHDELLHVRFHPAITTVKFKDFVQRHHRDDLLALCDIVKCDRRRWNSVLFQETIEGCNYRRWQYKKDNVQRTVDQALHIVGLFDTVPVCFDEHLSIDMNQMSPRSIISLLWEVAKDPDVTSITFNGYIDYTDVESIVACLIGLLERGDRRYKSVVFRCSFVGGEGYAQWNHKISFARRLLEQVSAKQGIPIGFHVC